MLLMLYFISVATTLSTQEWAWSVHPESGFKILAPYALTDHISEVPVEGASIQYHQYRGGSVTDSILSMAFVVDYYQLPGKADTVDEKFLRDFFENSIDPVLTAVHGSLDYMDVNREAGRDVCTWKGNYHGGEGIIRGQYILVGDRYYGLQVFGWAKSKPDETMNRFFNSFKLIP
ncbi:MAG TPA: hypothetical protein VJ508_20495 [Saprospiraceae bacterium]|nr:hypothetical protein [Saprospiraceae bacterium]